MYRFNLKGLDSRIADKNEWLQRPFGGSTMREWLQKPGTREFVERRLIDAEMELGYIFDGRQIEKMRPTSLEYWTAHRVYLQGLIANEPDCPVLQGELEYADGKLEAIANGTHKRAVILHSVITIGLRSTTSEKQEMLEPEMINAALSLLTPDQRLVAQRQIEAYAKDGSYPTNEEVVIQLQREGTKIFLADLTRESLT